MTREESSADAKQMPTSRRELWLVCTITAVGAGLRLINLGAQSLWYDEFLSVALARKDWAQVIAGTIQADVHPPLYYLLLHAALQFGSDEIATRAISCVFSIATIPLLYTLARQWFAHDVAALATGIAAINPLHVLFAQEARMYAQLGFVTLLALYGLQRALSDGRARHWGLFGGALAVMLYTHNLAFLYAIALDTFALVQRRRLGAQWRQFAMAHAIVALAFLPWLPKLLEQLERVRTGFWGTTPSVLNVLAAPFLLLFGTGVPFWLVPLGLFAGLALIAFGLMASLRAWRSGQAEALGLAAAVVIFLVPLLLLFGLSLLGTIFVERILLPASLGLYLLVAWALLRARPRTLNLALGAVILLVTVGALGAYYFDPGTQKPHLREATQHMAQMIEQGDVIVHTSDSSALAWAYYAPQEPVHFLSGDPDFEHGTERAIADRYVGLAPEELDSLVVHHTRLWLIVALDHNEEYQREWVARLDARYGRASTDNVLGINLFLYRLPAAAGVDSRTEGQMPSGQPFSQRSWSWDVGRTGRHGIALCGLCSCRDCSS